MADLRRAELNEKRVKLPFLSHTFAFQGDTKYLNKNDEAWEHQVSADV